MVNDDDPFEFKYLVQILTYLLESEQDSKYYIEEGQQPEQDIQDLLSAHKLEISEVESIENLPRILEYTKELIAFLEEKYCKFEWGYYYYKDAVKRMREFVPILEEYHIQK